jgi:hypothetical protein
MTVDPSTVSVGSPILDGHAVRAMWGGGKRSVQVACTTRTELGSDPAGLPTYAATCRFWTPRGPKTVGISYSLEEAENGFIVTMQARATLDELGLGPPSHPFVVVLGPVELSASVSLRPSSIP